MEMISFRVIVLFLDHDGAPTFEPSKGVSLVGHSVSYVCPAKFASPASHVKQLHRVLCSGRSDSSYAPTNSLNLVHNQKMNLCIVHTLDGLNVLRVYSEAAVSKIRVSYCYTELECEIWQTYTQLVPRSNRPGNDGPCKLNETFIPPIAEPQLEKLFGRERNEYDICPP